MKRLCFASLVVTSVVLMSVLSAAAAGDAAELLLKWGSYGSGEGQFNYPWGVAVYSQGDVYVADALNHRIQKFTSGGVFQTKWGSRGSGEGQFSYPYSVAIDSKSNVYVADAFNHRIQKFTPGGTFVKAWGSYGSADSQFNYPYGVALDNEDNVYVTDSRNHRIQKFTSDGLFQTKWGGYGSGDGQFNGPYGIATDPQRNVYVADNGNHRIQKFTSQGLFQMKWGSYGAGEGQFSYPRGISADSSGIVYVVDHVNSRIQEFASSGAFIAAFGGYGSGDGQFNLPVGVAVDSQNTQNNIYVYVADTGNARIQKLRVINVTPTVDAGADATINEGDTLISSGSFADPDTDTWTGKVDYGDGSDITPLTLTGKTFGLSHVYSDNGIYRIVVKITDNHGSVGGGTKKVTVTNLAPKLSAIPDRSVYSGDNLSFGVTFVDPGILDTHSAIVNWGDGMAEPAKLADGRGSGNVAANHVYVVPGSYSVNVVVTDNDGGAGSGTFKVDVKYIPVTIDVRPGSGQNVIQPDSKGVVSVAILSTTTFDSRSVEPASIRFGPAGADPAKYALEDVDKDGDIDLVLHFRTQETGIESGDAETILTGRMKDGRYIKGTDSMRTVPSRK